MTAPNTETRSLLKQISNQNPDGVEIGKTAADPVGFYGITPVVQAGAIAVTAGDTSTVVAAAVVAIVAALKGIGITA